MPYNLEYLRGLSVTATDDLGRTATATTTLDLDTTVYVDSVVVTDLTDGDGSVGHGRQRSRLGRGDRLLEPHSRGRDGRAGRPQRDPRRPGERVVQRDGHRRRGDGRSRRSRVRLGQRDRRGRQLARAPGQLHVHRHERPGDPPTVTGPTAANLDGPDDDVGDGDQVAVSVTATDGLGVDRVTADASDFGAGTVAPHRRRRGRRVRGTFTVNTTSASPDGAYGIEITAYNVRNRRSIGPRTKRRSSPVATSTPPTISDLTASDPFDDEGGHRR